jgi:GNAT superfamily N-acetyltransferase
MRFEEWELLPYQPGWKYEYWDGMAHITPNYQTAVTMVAVTPRRVQAPCVLRSVLLEDEAALLPVYLEAFADNQAFCDMSEEQFHTEARNDLREGFTGRRAPLLAASRVAVAPVAEESQLVGAALLSCDREYGPVLDLLFIRSAWHHRGVAAALVAEALNVLHQEGKRTLTSCYQLANPAGQAWHRAFGFVEKPDVQYARAYYRRATQELIRREKRGELTAEEHAALHAEVQDWRVQIEELEQLGQEQGFEAIYPRRPHW